MPVDSTTSSTSFDDQSMAAGSFSEKTAISRPSTMRESSSASTVWSKRGHTESNFSRWARVSVSVRSLMATTSKSASGSRDRRKRARPIRPKPLIAIRLMPRSYRSSSMSGVRLASVPGIPNSSARLSAVESRRRIRPATASFVIGGSAS
ncbi:Uncharacterised protein [Mycobacteroides abscessus subsp. abscessus]|nr:Uncharacterised protein [Mycobacteroides abscessus subsp. abscessus]